MRRQRCRSFHHGDAVLHRLLHLFEGTFAYLAHALTRDAKLASELLERGRFLGEPARLEDAALRPRAENIVALENAEVEPLPLKQAEQVPPKKGKKAA